MYKYLVVIFVGLPLVGIALMEQGAWGPSIGLYGHPNGATLAYAAYAGVLLLTSGLVIATARREAEVSWRLVDETAFRRLAARLVIAKLALLFLLLFYFDALAVWQGAVGKGEFRVSLGPFGSLAYYVTKLLVPAFFAYLTALYTAVNRRGVNRLLWWTALLTAFLVGTCWGYKATPIFVVLPGLLVLLWRVSIVRLGFVAGLGLAVVLFFYAYYDALKTPAEIGTQLWQRLTVVQGDVPWLVWDLYQQGEAFPDYLKTLTTVIGDRFFSLLTGIERGDFPLWVEYHYDLLLTELSGIPHEDIKAGHTITGTPFAEGVIAAGKLGPPLFGMLAGLLVGVFYVAIERGLRTASWANVGVLSTYFCSYVLTWLAGGAIVQLAHIAVVLGVLLSYIAVQVVQALSFGEASG